MDRDHPKDDQAPAGQQGGRYPAQLLATEEVRHRYAQPRVSDQLPVRQTHIVVAPGERSSLRAAQTSAP